MNIERKPLQIWQCKIGECPDESLPNAADFPMRDAVADAYERISGHKPAFIFSGWNAELTEGERAAHENRLPSPAMTDHAQRFIVRYRDESKYSEACWELFDTVEQRVVGTDGGEPEDQLLVRDWSWVAVELNKLHDQATQAHAHGWREAIDELTMVKVKAKEAGQ